MISKIELHSLNELIGAVDHLLTETNWRWWFRGEEEHSWPLLPRVRRGYTKDQERFLSNEFYTRARTRHHKCPNDDDWAGWLSTMQHYGLPTRLLDWSNSPLVAAFFATQRFARHGSRKTDTHASIWALAPGALNEAQGFEGYLYPLNAARLTKLLRPAIKGRDTTKKVVAAWAIETDPRMQVQQGAFTVHSSDLPLNKIKGSENWLRQFIIPVKDVHTIARELDLMGIRLADLFPDLDHLATELKARHLPKIS